MSQKPAIFGKLGPRWMGGSFREYDNGTVQGLATVSGKLADVLAIVAKTPGRGDGGRFLEQLQRNYTVVRIWAVTNPVLAKMLVRRGFTLSVEQHYDDETKEPAYVWWTPAAKARV